MLTVLRNFIIAVWISALAGCYLKQYPVTPAVAEASTYLLVTEQATGTAWAVDSRHAITAGHMCELVATHYVLVSSSFRRITATPTMWEYSDYNGHADLCVLEASADLSPGLVIADRMPAIGESVGFVGYPLGKLSSSSGKYLGDVDGDETSNDDTTSAPCDHGASGSAEFSSRGVFGVLVRMRTDGERVHDGSDGCVVIPLKELRAFLDSAGVHYVTTPELPEAPPEWAPEYHALG